MEKANAKGYVYSESIYISGNVILKQDDELYKPYLFITKLENTSKEG